MLTDKFEGYIKLNQLINRDDKILLAVSGGVDSMVMLHLFARCGYNIGVAHCNFMLRDEESDEDEEMVKREVSKLNIPLFNRQFNTQGEMDRSGDSVQIVARRLRYDWFADLREKHDYTAIATAHHSDDSIETFFINLFRGTGLKGLTGIHAVNGKIIRPLLFASRKEILDYAHSNHICFREDSSNRSTKYLRNKIRLGLIPRIKEMSAKFPELMGANIQRLTSAQIYINKSIEVMRKNIETVDREIVTIDPSGIESGYPIDFIIYELMCRYGFKGTTISDLCKSLERGSTGKRFYSHKWVAIIDRGKIIISKIEESDSCEVEVTDEKYKVNCGNFILHIEHLNIDNISTLQQPENIALLDRDKLTFPLKLRRWSAGDTFTPIGMSGHKKISDYLIDSKVSMADKSRQFVLLSGEQIVWLVGRRIDSNFKIDSKTENVVKITKEVI